MKIVQLITGSAWFGGAEAHVRDLAIGLKGLGHDCHVMVGPPEGLLSEQVRAAGIPVTVIPSLKKPMDLISDMASLVQVVSALRRLRPDVLATHTAKAGFVGRIAGKLTNVPSFFTPHGLSFVNRETGRPIKHRLLLEQLAASLGGRIIAVCDAERKLASEYLRISDKRIATIHNGLPDIVLPAKRRKPPVVITMVARLDLQKDHTALFRALSTLTHLSWELRLAGTGPLMSSAKLLAGECGLSARVHFLNHCSQIPELLAESDIFTLITKSEAFPISILEAMRSGLPVVATDTGGVGEAVRDGVTGFLVPRAGTALIAEKLALLITSPDLRQRMGLQSRLRFSREFEWSSMLKNTEAMYAEALPKALEPERASVTSA